jgi:hypothetical protein
MGEEISAAGSVKIEKCGCGSEPPEVKFGPHSPGDDCNTKSEEALAEHNEIRAFVAKHRGHSVPAKERKEPLKVHGF